MTEDETKDQISFIEKAVQKKYNCKPRFYVVGGSHIYGFPSPPEEGGDVDIRGFHTAPKEEFLKLGQPKEQIEINCNDNPTNGFGSHPEYELVSYELRKFGKMLHKMNFNVLEWMFHGQEIMNGIPLEMDSLRMIVKDHLPSDTARHYRGMAKSNYKKFLNEDLERYRPSAKKFLYVIRGLLAAENVSKSSRIEANISLLAKRSDLLDSNDREFIQHLIEVKKDGEEKYIDENYQEYGHNLILRLFNELDIEIDSDKDKLEKEIDDWMLKVRNDGWSKHYKGGD